MITKFLAHSLRFKSLVVKSHTRSIATMKYLKQDEAINLDLELFNEYKFSVDQLMELAGLSCAHVAAKEFPLNADNSNNLVFIACGPGNNGGDGLVMARHLSLMNFKPTIYYPKKVDKPLFNNLVTQCELMDISFADSCPNAQESSKYRFIADALFGFSFKPPVRDSFKDVMTMMSETSVPIVSIDIPSGWNVENGPENDPKAIKPHILVSLTAPKLCANFFKGIHYLGGRFVPNRLAEKYQLMLPQYPGTDLCIKLN